MSVVEQAAGPVTATVDLVHCAAVLSVAVPAGAHDLYVSRQRTNNPPTGYAEVRGYAQALPPNVAGVAGGAPLTVYDYEAPIGYELAYSAFTRTSSTAPWTLLATSAPLTLPASLGDWLVDLAKPANNVAVNIESFAERDYSIPEATLRVLTRRDPVVVSDVAWTWQSTLVLLTLEPGDARTIRDVIGNGLPVLLKTPASEQGSSYLSVLDFKSARIGPLGTQAERRLTIDVVQIARPDPGIYKPTPPVTYSYVHAHFASYAALLASGQYGPLTYNDLEYLGTWQPVEVFPWPPDDV